MAPGKRKSEADANEKTPKKRVCKSKRAVTINFTTAPSQQTSALMRLPAELRNTIYEMASRNLKHTWPKPNIHNGHVKGPQEPGFVVACKQTYAEALKMCYANADFAFNSPERANAWMQMVPQYLQKLVEFKVVFATVDTDDESEMADALSLAWDPELIKMTVLVYAPDREDHHVLAESIAFAIHICLTVKANEVLGFSYRLEYGTHTRQQTWTPFWPRDPQQVLTTYLMGSGATREQNLEKVQESNLETPQESVLVSATDLSLSQQLDCMISTVITNKIFVQVSVRDAKDFKFPTLSWAKASEYPHRIFRLT